MPSYPDFPLFLAAIGHPDALFKRRKCLISFIIMMSGLQLNNTKLFFDIFHEYLRWDKNFPVECPDPSHPGTGHLQSIRIILFTWHGSSVSKLGYICRYDIENVVITLEVLLLFRLLGDSLAYLLSGNQKGYDEKNSYQKYDHFHHIPKLDTSYHKMLTKWFCLANLLYIPS